MRNAALALLSLLLAAPLLAQQHKLAELSFLEGNWTLDDDGVIWDEQWTAARGDSMLGMCRAVRDGKTFFYELLTIEQDASGPVLKLKHFKRGLIGREEKDEVPTMPLVSLDGTTAVFANDAVRITYELEKPGVLYSSVEKKGKDGKPEKLEFRYRAAE